MAPSRLRWAPRATVALLAAPVAAGMLGLVGPAFGLDPGAGLATPTLAVWRELFAWPGLGRAVALSVGVGVAATLAALALTLALLAAAEGTAAFRLLRAGLAPLLALPHAAAAFGLAFLIAPSGWLVRLFSPWATGWTAPPDALVVNDPHGLSLAAGLVLKETPFLLLMALAALPQTDAARAVRAGRALGRGPAAAFLAGVAPRLWPQLRLPVYAALAYAMATVDMALILGPTTPPTLSAQILLWASDPDLGLRGRAAAAGLAQAALILLALGAFRLGEAAVWALGRRWIAAGAPLPGEAALRRGAAAAALALVATAGLAIAGLAVWSVAGLWTFPHALPDALSGRAWSQAGDGLAAAAGETVLIGLAATLIGLGLTLGCLEAEGRGGRRPGDGALWLLWLPLIAPQAGFLLGLQTLAIWAGADGARGPVIAAHAVFVTPYVFLALADPWRAWDGRLGLAARALGAGPDRVFWAVRLPMLAPAVAAAAAVGFAVSAGLYLPTLLIGGGRVATLTTEAVALASGGDRRLIGVWALAQAAVPLAGFALALAAGRRWRGR